MAVTHLHIIDLDGSRAGTPKQMDMIMEFKKKGKFFCEVGGGIRNLETVAAYLDAGIDRVIIGTSAVTDSDFLRRAVSRYADRIAVAADVKNGYVMINGWSEKSKFTVSDFCRKMEHLGVSTIICTDISRDGSMKGSNLELYTGLVEEFPNLQFIASGGVSSLTDVEDLAEAGLYGAIIGKAYCTGAIDIAHAIDIVK